MITASLTLNSIGFAFAASEKAATHSRSTKMAVLITNLPKVWSARFFICGSYPVALTLIVKHVSCQPVSLQSGQSLRPIPSVSGLKHVKISDAKVGAFKAGDVRRGRRFKDQKRSQPYGNKKLDD